MSESATIIKKFYLYYSKPANSIEYKSIRLKPEKYKSNERGVIPKQSSYAIHPVMANNAPLSTSYRSCWHVVSLGFLRSITSLF